jgi:hypothetical protein
MRNYRDLRVWGTADKLTLAIYRDTHKTLQKRNDLV